MNSFRRFVSVARPRAGVGGGRPRAAAGEALRRGLAGDRLTPLRHAYEFVGVSKGEEH